MGIESSIDLVESMTMPWVVLVVAHTAIGPPSRNFALPFSITFRSLRGPEHLEIDNLFNE